MTTLWRLLLSLLLALGCAPAWAHKPSDSYLSLRAQADGRIEAQWDIALRDLDYLLQLDRDGNAEITWGEVRQRSGELTELATRRLALRSGDQACAWQPEDPSRPLALDRHSDGTYAVLRLQAVCPALVSSLVVQYSLLFDVDPTHRGLVLWQPLGETRAQPLVFATDSAQQTLSLTAPSAWETLRQYVAEGAWHIWIGFDHILFLLALLLPAVLLPAAGRWAPVESLRPAVMDTVRVVTAFTLAHSITLSLAALQWVALPSRWVESVIAASVVLAAVNNLFPRANQRRWQMALLFGLIHGFGFASVLADLGLPAGALVLALVGFNVGVELGQLAIVGAFLPVAFALRHTAFYRIGVVAGGSLVIAALASWWLVQRAFDL